MADRKLTPPKRGGNEWIPLTHQRLLEKIHYDPETGIFRWKNRCGQIKGAVAGHIGSKGYRFIMIDWKNYSAHILAFFYVNGRWATDQVDHRNRHKDDNRFSNLREATNSQNHANVETRKDNTSGFKGVYWNKRDKKWAAYINFNGKRHSLGYYVNKIDAHAAYVEASKKFFGEFSVSA